MRSFELMLGRCLGALVLSAGCAAAGSSPAALSGIAAAMTPSLERAATPQTPPASIPGDGRTERVRSGSRRRASERSTTCRSDKSNSAEIGSKSLISDNDQKAGLSAAGRHRRLWAHDPDLSQSGNARSISGSGDEFHQAGRGDVDSEFNGQKTAGSNTSWRRRTERRRWSQFSATDGFRSWTCPTMHKSSGPRRKPSAILPDGRTGCGYRTRHGQAAAQQLVVRHQAIFDQIARLRDAGGSASRRLRPRQRQISTLPPAGCGPPTDKALYSR